MMILRFTTKAFRKFGQKPQLVEVDKADKDFGEWYVNTVDSANRGNLFMTIMHIESLYTMLVPIEKSMDLSGFVHVIFTNLLLRILWLEVPRVNAEIIVESYNDQAVFAKTNSRSLVASLSTVIKDLNAIMEYPERFVKDNKLDMTRLEHHINDSPRSLSGETVWPLEAFYKCIRSLCPELPARKPLPLQYSSMRAPEKLMDIFADKISGKLAMKVEASSLGAEVLFNLEEITALLNAVQKQYPRRSNTPERLYADLERMLNFQLKKLESQV